MILLITSFVAGLLTVLAPCTLPFLPIIVGGSLDGKVNIKKALTVILSLGVSVIVFTFALKVSTLFINIPQSVWAIISGGIILVFGLITLFPSLWEWQWVAKLSMGSNRVMGEGNKKKSFWGDVIVGAALGPVFSTCSPTYFIILATVLPVKPILGLTYLLVYTVGLCIMLLAIAFLGQKILAKLGVAANPKGTFKKVLGILFIIIGIGIIFSLDKKLESVIADKGFYDVTKVEQGILQKNEPAGMNTNTADAGHLTLAQKEQMYQKAPELASIAGYINTDDKPITLAQLKGKVVLVDFWTYSCINCQRTLPYVNDWYAKYKDDGFVVVGVHTPEFSFEKVQSNVEDAVKKFGIMYPVVLDNNYGTWQAFGNEYWPREYLIDADGFIVHDHAGEGDYDVTEHAIQNTLQERAQEMDTKVSFSQNTTAPTNTISINPSKVNSPETYFGSARNEYLANGTPGSAETQSLSVPKNISQNQLYLGGAWNFQSEYAENSGPAEIDYAYDAKNVYMAAGSDAGIEVQVYKDGAFVKKITIKGQQLYPLIEGSEYGKHTLRIVVPKAGLQAFTFTFG